MARYIRDYHIRFLVDGSKVLTYTSVDHERPMHVKFKATYGDKLSRLDLSIFNMNPESRKVLQSDDVKILVQVGFRDTEKPDESTLNTVFLGNVDKEIVTHTKSADHETKISASEGYDMQELKIQGAYAPGTSHVEVIADLMSKVTGASGGMVVYDPSELNDLNITQVYKKGHTLSGVAEKILSKLLITHNLEYNVAQGTLRIYRKGKSIQNRTHSFDLGSGLLEVPKPIAQAASQAQSNPLPTKGYKFKLLLAPELIPQSKIEVAHSTLGKEPVELIVRKVTHTGGYESNEWYSTVETLIPSDGKKENSIAEAKTNPSGVDSKKKLTEG